MASGKDEKKSLIEFPCKFRIKVMGANADNFLETVAALVSNFDESVTPDTIDQRPSSSGKYLGLTCEVFVNNQEELDEVYRTLSTHPMVSVVL